MALKVYRTPFQEDLDRFLRKYGIALTNFDFTVNLNTERETLAIVGKKEPVVLNERMVVDFNVYGELVDIQQYEGILNGDIEVEPEDMTPVDKKTKKGFQKMVIEGNYKRKFNFGNKEKS